MIIIYVCLALLVILEMTPAGDPIKDRFGTTGIVIFVALVGGLMFALTALLSEAFVGMLFNPGNRLETRRRMLKQNARKTKREIKLDAMSDTDLEAWIEKNPKDALAVEVSCERLKLKGDIEGYAREREYLLTLDLKLSPEERCSLYNELADLYIGRLGRPERAREALVAVTRQMPKSYQATLARQRLREIEDAAAGAGRDLEDEQQG